MPEKISPEERLFNVIQEGKNLSPREAVSLNKKIIRGFSLIKRFYANLVPRTVAIPIRFEEIEPRNINKGLAIILVFLMGTWGYYAVNKKPNIAKIVDAVSKIQFHRIEKNTIEPFEPLSFYLEEVTKRDIFNPLPVAKEEPVVVEEDLNLDKLKEMAGHLKLQGISWGDAPKVMIKNEEEDKIYFLKEGQMIGSMGIEVKKILKDKVVIGYEGEEIDLL